MIKQLTLVFSILVAALCASAQTNDTFTMDGSKCSVYGCFISIASETDSAWGTPGPEFPPPPATPVYNAQTHQTAITGLPVKTYGYRSFAAIPQHAVGTGTAMEDWAILNGTHGSFTVPIACTWDYTPIPNPVTPNNPIPEFTEACVGTPDVAGENVNFTRHWWATAGRYGYWSLNQLINENAGIVDFMTLIDQSTVAILDKDQNNPFRETVTVAEFRWPSWLRWLFGASEPVEIYF